MSDLLRVLVVLGLVGANAFFVIAEYSVVTARRGRLAEWASAGRAGARAALRLMDDPVRVISTVQVGITAIGILTGAIGEPLVRDLLGDGIPAPLSFVIAFATVTYLSVVLGELVPKALSLDRAETLAMLVARPIELIAALLRPVVWILQRSGEVVLRPFGVREVVIGETIRSPDELRALVDEAEKSGVIPRAQEEMLHNVFRFVDREAADVMVAASDVAWLELDATCDDALTRALRTPHDRYPVGRGSLDRLAGVVHLRELVAAARTTPSEPLESLVRPPLIVPETKDLGPLLRELREQRQHLAVVVDEYGGTAGIVTLEDVLEEIVGEIDDEFELPDGRLVWLDERTVEVAGSMTIDDFNETVGTQLPQPGVRTIAGLVFNVLGRRPAADDHVNVDAVRLTVGDVQGARITRVRAELPVRPEPRPAG
jgi:putative hemolysin